MAVFRLDVVTTYFSDAVVGGFSTGAACHVFVTQLCGFFGLPKIQSHHGFGELFIKLYQIIRKIPKNTNVITLLLSSVLVLILCIGKFYINPFLKKKFKLSVPVPFELLLVNFFKAKKFRFCYCHYLILARCDSQRIQVT